MIEHIQSECHRHCLTITLNRPDKYNALTNAMYDRLTAILKAAGSDDNVRVVVITGGTECFTAGNDLADFLQAPPQNLDAPAFRFMAAVVALDKPLIAAVCGPAIGIGTTLLPHCDLVMATRDSRFATPFVKLGLCQEFAASLLLPQRVGHGTATRLLLGGESIDGAQARASGLCTHLFDQGRECLDFAKDYAERLATASPAALQTAKRLMKTPQRASVLSIMGEENQHFIARLQAPECRQALEDFVNKRR